MVAENRNDLDIFEHLAHIQDAVGCPCQVPAEH